MIPKLRITDTSLEKAIPQIVSVLKAGGMVVVPSDTVYGLSADATNNAAVEKLMQFKDRPAGKAISVFVKDIQMAEEHVEVSAAAKKTLESLTPGPYTFILPSRHTLVKSLEGENRSLGIRIPHFSFIAQLVSHYRKPLTATSANTAGMSPHYTVESFLKSLSQKKQSLIDLIVDYGSLPYRKPSSVVDLMTDSLQILRQGNEIPLETHISISVQQTQILAADFVKKISKKTDRAIIILRGDLGVGKTVFVKGIGEFLGVDGIVSPTYVVCYEYKTKNSVFKKLHHCDFYNIREAIELDHLGLDSMLSAGNLLVIEWGEKAGDVVAQFKKNSSVFMVQLEHIDRETRRLLFFQLTV